MSCFPHVSYVPCEFDQNPPIGSLDRAQTRGYTNASADGIHTHTHKKTQYVLPPLPLKGHSNIFVHQTLNQSMMLLPWINRGSDTSGHFI